MVEEKFMSGWKKSLSRDTQGYRNHSEVPDNLALCNKKLSQTDVREANGC